jgi:hypothetical protein
MRGRRQPGSHDYHHYRHDFDQHRYDERADVLYLNVGEPRPAPRGLDP